MENFATKKPNDFVIATGKNYSVKQFIDEAAKKFRNENLLKGKGINT